MTVGAPFRTFITPEALSRHRDTSWVLIDARCSLDDPEWGAQVFHQGHVPGAVFADLNLDLSGAAIAGATGRRPLPAADQLAERLQQWGVSRHTQVVIYDSSSGSRAAARLWVLLRWLGHADAAVLVGGFPAWLRRGYPLDRALRRPRKGDFEPRQAHGWIADAADVTAALGDPGVVLIDGRPVDVYAGSCLSFDPVAGHIPGARCFPATETESAMGGLQVERLLRQRYSALGAADPGVTTRIAYCGSGVWAAQHVLVMTHLGLDNSRLYVGSFSEWVADETRPTQILG